MTEQLKPELLPCPFCGGKAELLEDFFNNTKFPDRIAVQCNSCFANSFSFLGWQPDATSKAIAAWNTRAKQCEHDWENDYSVTSAQYTGVGKQCKLCGKLQIKWNEEK